MVSLHTVSRTGEVVTMVASEPAANTTDETTEVAAQSVCRRPQSSMSVSPVDPYVGATLNSCESRGVLDGAFSLLEALGHVDDGLGLTALARASGLAKSSAYRLAEQLVSLGAAQRVNQRYYIGARLGRIGQRWQPDPWLRQAAIAPVHQLAVQARAVALLRVLHDHRLRAICGTMPRHAFLPEPTEAETIARTATGRVLYATQPVTGTALPDCWTPREWRQLRESLHHMHAAVIDREEAFPGVFCVSAPVRRKDGTCAGALTAVVEATKPTAGLRDLVVRAARCITTGLQ